MASDAQEEMDGGDPADMGYRVAGVQRRLDESAFSAAIRFLFELLIQWPWGSY